MQMQMSPNVDWPVDQYKVGYHHNNPRPSNPLRRKHRPKLADAPFLAWDGEGYTDDNGKHHYMLWGCKTEHVRSSQLDWQDCFPLLLKHPNEINIIYGGDYDIVKMIQSMPLERRHRIMHGKWTRYGGYNIQWIRRKMLRIKDINTGQTATLYDVLPFFQTTFVEACREYLGDDETLREMHKMKLQRDKFALDDPAVLGYWRSELEYLEELMTLFRELLADVDLVPSRGWYGPGAIANRVMRTHEMRRFYGGVPEHITDLAERAYYGGRFEQFKIGRFEHAYEYDIRSAYPSAIAKLPDFSNVQWEHKQDCSEASIMPFGLYCVSWKIRGTGRSVGPFPWRAKDGAIYFPLVGTESWYWGIELLAAMKTYSKWITIHEAWIPKLGNRQPFPWVPEMYDQRAHMKASGNPAEKGLKLALNSLYGKVAQSIGAIEHEGQWRKPTWHHALWAGWITAYTRAMIMKAIGEQSGSLIAIETDAVFVSRKLDLDIGFGLGQWERTDLDSILYVRSGIYHAILDGGLKKLKSRGIESSYVYDENYWLDVFKKLPHETVTITTRTRRFGTDLRQPWRFGNWYEQQLSITLPNTFSKRVHMAKRCLGCRADKSYADMPHDLIAPQPFIDSDIEPSTPYKFPWRQDVKYDWPEYSKGEHIETLGDVTWQ